MSTGDDILDAILLKIGDIGRQQLVVLSCLCLVVLFHSATHIAYVFTSMDSEYRCLIPECEDKFLADPNSLREVVPFSKILDKPLKCQMYQHENISSNSCSYNDFDKDSITRCVDHFFYSNEYYLGREFNLLCEENLWALSLVGTTNTIGMFLGLIVTGFISDRFGRKRLLLIGISGCGLIGLIKTMSTSFTWFLIFELIEAIFSAGTCGCVFIIGVELVIPKRRALVGSILNTCYCLGEVLLAIIAWLCRSWRPLIYYTYGPCSMLILLYLILPESLRWMLSKGRIEESKQALRKTAKKNRKELSEDTLNKLDEIKYSSKTRHTFADILRSKCLFRRFLNCCFGWITCAFLFYGITLNSVTLYGNKYLDFILISLIELPAYWCCNYILDRIGRRPSICGSYLITVVACLCFTFVIETTPGWLHLIIYCIGKFGATAAFYVIYVITSEVFPTPLRHTVMGLCSTVGRLGSLTSPQTPLLSQFWGPLPMLLFALMSGAAGISSLFLPETKGLTLPDTIEEAENI